MNQASLPEYHKDLHERAGGWAYVLQTQCVLEGIEKSSLLWERTGDHCEVLGSSDHASEFSCWTDRNVHSHPGARQTPAAQHAADFTSTPSAW